MFSMQDVVIKVLTDASFRDELIANPEQTLLSVGISPEADIVATLRNTDPAALRALAETFTTDGLFAADCGGCNC